MRQNVIITCAVTGAGDTPKKIPHVPATPKEIAEAAIEAAKAGAAIADIHVCDPQTGGISHDPHYSGKSLNVYVSRIQTSS